MSITRGCVPMDHVISRCSDQSDLRTVVCCHESHCNGQGRARELRSVTDGEWTVGGQEGGREGGREGGWEGGREAGRQGERKLYQFKHRHS